MLVYERDNVRELGSRLLTYLIQHDSFFLYGGYEDYFASSLVYLLESKLQDLGFANPTYPLGSCSN